MLSSPPESWNIPKNSVKARRKFFSLQGLVFVLHICPFSIPWKQIGNVSIFSSEISMKNLGYCLDKFELLSSKISLAKIFMEGETFFHYDVGLIISGKTPNMY